VRCNVRRQRFARPRWGGIVRNTYIECAREGLTGFGDMPAEEILARARAL
jgi:hypothetical protein